MKLTRNSHQNPLISREAQIQIRTVISNNVRNTLDENLRINEVISIDIAEVSIIEVCNCLRNGSICCGPEIHKRYFEPNVIIFSWVGVTDLDDEESQMILKIRYSITQHGYGHFTILEARYRRKCLCRSIA